MTREFIPVFRAVSDTLEAVATGRVREAWDANASAWAAARAGGGQVVVDRLYGDAALRLLASGPGERILDLGCGEGGFASRIVASGAEVLGVDLSPQMIRAARARWGHVARLRFEVADISSVTSFAETGEFDAAFSIMALKDLPDLPKALATVARATRTGGRFVFVIYHPAFAHPGAGWHRRTSEWVHCTGNYIDEVAVSEVWQPEGSTEDLPHPVYHFHRRLETYIEAMADVGLYVEHMEEICAAPRAAPAGFDAKVPLYLLVKAIRS
jgi:SAM-dependent methyltransferase